MKTDLIKCSDCGTTTDGQQCDCSQEKTVVETAIPFCGFYESFHQSKLEQALGVSEDDFYEAENCTRSEGEPTPEELEKKYESIDWKKERIDYCKSYVEEIGNLLGMKLEFVDLQSPREYNFTTDRIFCNISSSDVVKLQKKIDHNKMCELVKKRFTSRDGFSSFYDNDYNQWLANDLFDHNQIETLIECYLTEKEGDDWEIYTMDEYWV